jgi:hypothetical protein
MVNWLFFRQTWFSFTGFNLVSYPVTTCELLKTVTGEFDFIAIGFNTVISTKSTGIVTEKTII